MVWTDLLTVKHIGAPNACKFQTPGNVFVHQTSDIEHRAATTHGERLVSICRFTRRLGVDTDDLQRAKKKGRQILLTRHKSWPQEDASRGRKQEQTYLLRKPQNCSVSCLRH